MDELSGAHRIFVEFADFDGSSNMIADVPLGCVPSVGERLNVLHEEMTYYLEVEEIIKFVDCDGGHDPAHIVTIGGRLMRSMPRHRAAAE